MQQVLTIECCPKDNTRYTWVTMTEFCLCSCRCHLVGIVQFSFIENFLFIKFVALRDFFVISSFTNAIL